VSLTPSGYEMQWIARGLLQHWNSLLLSKKAPDLTQASALLVIALPFSVLQNLQVHKNTRAGVYGILLLGAVDIAISLARFLNIQLGNENNFRAMTLIGMSFPFSFLKLQNVYLLYQSPINLSLHHLSH
jgi:heme/copper-type cytochrome/quinol oxidase subunit 4